jgi:hypothetical protein
VAKAESGKKPFEDDDEDEDEDEENFPQSDWVKEALTSLSTFDEFE